MKELVVLLFLAAVVSLLTILPASTGTGNGAPSGQHFTLNITGVPNPKITPITDSQRHTISVPFAEAFSSSGNRRKRVRANRC